MKQQQVSNLKKIAIVAIPTMDHSDFEYLQNLRQKYDPKGYAFIVPHFTLFSTSKFCSNQNFAEILAKSLLQQKKIHFSLRTAIFMPPLNEHKSWYAFLIPNEGFNELLSLYRAVCLAISPHIQQDENYFFIPHLTLGSFAYKADCFQLVNQMNATEFELSGHIEKIVVVEDNNNSASVIEQFRLSE